MGFLKRLLNRVFKPKAQPGDSPGAPELPGDGQAAPPDDDEVTEVTVDQLERMIERGEVEDDGRGDPAAIQAYEEYKSSDDTVTDSLGDVSEAQIENIDATRERIEQELERDETKTRVRALDSVGKDQDEELMRLLEIDEMEDERRDAALSPERDESEESDESDESGEPAKKTAVPEVYVKIATDEPEPETPPKHDFLASIAAKIPMKIMRIAIMAMAVIIMGFAAAIIIISLPAKEEPQAATIITRYSYPNIESSLGGEEITLKKAAYDEYATVIYFDRVFEVGRYNVTLVDDNGGFYGLDTSFAPYVGLPDTSITILRFAPLDEGASSFTLSLEDTSDENAGASFEVAIDDNRAASEAKFAAGSAVPVAGGDSFSVDVLLARFASTGSEVYFSLNWKGGGELYFADQSEAVNPPPIISAKAAGGISAAKPAPNIYFFESAIAGRMDYGTIKNSGGSFSVTFNDLRARIPVNKTINAASAEKLHMSIEDANIVVQAGDYDLCFERIVQAGAKLYLILHTENRSVPKADEDDWASRVEAVVDAEMHIKGERGDVSVIGSARAKREGSDILFDATDYIDQIGEINPENISILIKSADVAVGSVTAEINTAESADAGETASGKLDSLRHKITTAFKSRLAYKAGAAPIGEVSGFSPDVLADKTLARYYSPIAGAEGARASVSVTAYAYDKADAEKVYIVVRESWRAAVNGETVRFDVTHKVTAMDSPSGFVVIADEIAM